MHESCGRKVPQDCRPVAEAGDRMLHLWKPAGVVLHDSSGEVSQSLSFLSLYGAKEAQRPFQHLKMPE